MKHPKKKDMIPFMGKLCRFVKGELCRTYLKKQIKGRTVFDPFFDNVHGHGEKTPVRWKIAQFTPKVGFTTGWIVGFGFCFNGYICKESREDGGYKYFRSTKRIDYVRVRLTPTGKEIKVPAKNIKRVFD